ETCPESDEIKPLNFALNGVGVSRRDTTSMTKVETLVNDKDLTAYWSDGRIDATPTRCTGLSLSCGEPVTDPESSNTVRTTVAWHNLNARPLVIPDFCTIALKVSGMESSFLVSMDSRIATLENETSIIIKKAPFTIKLLQLHDD